jgi:predicted dienelactone hydrolase
MLLSVAAWLAAPAAQAQVGMTRMSAGELRMALVYPTADAARPVVQGSFNIAVAMDATPTPGMHRLVVMSHGTGGDALPDHAMAATLARAGFIVAQPLHAGDNHADFSKAGPASWVTRPAEISAAIDALAASPVWQPLLQLDKVGVHGMSAGGGTALVMAGARWRTLDLVRHCADHGEEDAGFCFNGAATEAAGRAQGGLRAWPRRTRGLSAAQPDRVAWRPRGHRSAAGPARGRGERGRAPGRHLLDRKSRCHPHPGGRGRRHA